MTTYYVSTAGNDASNGLGPDASAVTNKPWLTIGKALGAAGIASGDTVYIAPGTYREAVTVAMTSAVAETLVYGDPTNAQGFRTALGAAVAAGPVVWTAYTTNDTTAPGLITVDLAGRDFLTFQDILFVGGASANAMCVSGLTATSTDCTFRRCAFEGAAASHLVQWANTAGVALNLTLDRCAFLNFALTGGGAVRLVLARHTADYDANVLVRNCAALAQFFVFLGSSGAGAFGGGGVRVRDCTAVCGSNMLAVTGGSVMALAYPLEVSNCVLTGGGTGFGAGTVGQMVEDYNLIAAGTARSNTSIGPFSVAGAPPARALAVQPGYEPQWGLIGRSPLMPLAASGINAFGNAILATGNTPTVADDATVGTIAWTNPTNASLPEGTNLAVASTIPATTGVSHYLNATAHAGFSGIPSDATIKSVRVELGVKASAGTAIACSSVKLVKASVIGGNDLASTNTTQFSTTLAAQSWGNTADPLWGNTLAVTDVQAAGFGCVWAGKNTSGAGVDCSVDFVRVIVAYTTADGHGGVATDLLGVTRPMPEAVGALEYSVATVNPGPGMGMLGLSEGALIAG